MGFKFNLYFLYLALLAPFTLGLVINEFDLAQIGQNKQFLELYNEKNVPVDLSQYTVGIFKGNAMSPSFDNYTLQGTLMPHSYYVICENPRLTPNCNGVAPRFLKDSTAIVLFSQSKAEDSISYGIIPLMLGRQNLNEIVDILDLENVGISRVGPKAGVRRSEQGLGGQLGGVQGIQGGSQGLSGQLGGVQGIQGGSQGLSGQLGGVQGIQGIQGGSQGLSGQLGGVQGRSQRLGGVQGIEGLSGQLGGVQGIEGIQGGSQGLSGQLGGVQGGSQIGSRHTQKRYSIECITPGAPNYLRSNIQNCPNPSVVSPRMV